MFGHCFYGVPDISYSFFCNMLECYLAVETVKIHSAKRRSVAVSRQRVVCSARIIACTFARVFPEKHASGVDNFFCQSVII